MLESIKPVFLLTASVLTLAGTLSPAHAGMPKKGVPSEGVYWGLEKDPFGRVYYECFDETTNATVSGQKCTDAKAKKPAHVIRRTDLM